MPSTLNTRHTVVLPLPMPPVRPTVNMCGKGQALFAVSSVSCMVLSMATALFSKRELHAVGHLYQHGLVVHLNHFAMQCHQ
jgi:uncharacterized protein YigE (DUF2233 family)